MHNTLPENEAEWSKFRCFLTFYGVTTAPNGLKFCEQIVDDDRNKKMSSFKAEDT